MQYYQQQVYFATAMSVHPSTSENSASSFVSNFNTDMQSNKSY